MKRIQILTPLAALLALSSPSAAQCSGCCNPEEIFPLGNQVPSPDDNDEFGFDVDSIGNYLVVGAPGFNGGQGAVFAYIRSGASWSLDNVLYPPAAAGNGRFGFSVAIGRSLVVVGAPDSDVAGVGTGVGTAYVFLRNSTGWVLEQELPPNQGGFTNYGWDVDIDLTSVVVGNKGEEAAYFWRRQPSGPCSPALWCLEDKVYPPPGISSLCYAEAVAIDKNTAIVGGSEYHMFVNVGAVFHYERAGSDWFLAEPELINPMFTGPGEHYGETVELDGDWLMVAEPKGGGGGDGLVFAYKRNPDGTFGPSSGYEQILDDGPDATTFGRSLSLRGDRILIGAPFTDIGFDSDAGTAYLFSLVGGTWSLADTYVPCNLLSTGDRLGNAVGLGKYAAAGAKGDDYSGFTDAGSTYTFHLP